MQEALSAVSPDVRTAAIEAHEMLRNLGVPHLLVGGLAVGAYGYARATRDVDFLVARSAFEPGRRVLIFVPGVPTKIDDIAVDYLLPDEGTGMQEALESDGLGEELAAVPIEMLFYMKLSANRAKDRADVVELLKAGAPAKFIRSYVERVAPKLLQRLDDLAEEAAAES